MVDLLALGTSAQVGQDVFAAGLDPLTHLVPEPFHVTATHRP
jgi:hypothetical protein